ncbi:MAG: hypothetical protein KGL74_13310, partial [Elusimicrobia bacterium]|nr:hypothetical protein [Elusimicrobiota bacterium]
RRLLSRAGAGADAGAAFAALFWSLHPLRVESVAWISERRDVLSGALILVSSWAYVRGAEAGDGAAGRRWRRWSLVLGAAAMASKVFAIVLPAVFLVLDERLRGRPRWREKLPWAVPAGVALAFNLAAQERSGAAVSFAVFGVKARLAQAFYGLAFGIGRTLWPSNLGPLYERSLLLEPLPFAMSAVSVALACAFLWARRRKNPAWTQAAWVYLLFALPALGLFKSGRMTAADRYTYLPSLPLALLAGAALTRLTRRTAAAAGAAALLLLGGLTARQLPVWGSDVALWTRSCEVSPLSYFARLKLSAALNAAGRVDEAALVREEAQSLHADVFRRAAAVYAARGDAAAAAAARNRAELGLPVELEMIK